MFPATEEAEEDGGWWRMDGSWLRDLDLGVIAVCYTPWMTLRRQGRRLEEFWLTNNSTSVGVGWDMQYTM